MQGLFYCLGSRLEAHSSKVAAFLLHIFGTAYGATAIFPVQFMFVFAALVLLGTALVKGLLVAAMLVSFIILSFVRLDALVACFIR